MVAECGLTSVPAAQVRPLNPEGSLFLYGTEKVRLTYLRNPLAGEGVGDGGEVGRGKDGGVTPSTSWGPWGLVSTTQLSASLAEKDEFDIPNLTDNSRRQLFRSKSKRRFFFRVSEAQLQQQRRCACVVRRVGGVSSLGGGAKHKPPPRGPGGVTFPAPSLTLHPFTPSPCREMLKDPFVRSKLISTPTNFNHLVHVGPADGRPGAGELPPGRVSPPEPITSRPGESEPITASAYLAWASATAG